MPSFRRDDYILSNCEDMLSSVPGRSFVKLGKVWQASLYEITLHICQHGKAAQDGDSSLDTNIEVRGLPIFNNTVFNETTDDAEAEFLDRHYILPRESCFYMSDLQKIDNLVPASPDCGFKLIVVDPPWENGSARQKSMYVDDVQTIFCAIQIISEI